MRRTLAVHRRNHQKADAVPPQRKIRTGGRPILVASGLEGALPQVAIIDIQTVGWRIMQPGCGVEDREILVSIRSGDAGAVRQDGFDLVARNPLARSGAFMRRPLLPRHAGQPCHADNGDLVAEKLLRKSGELVPTDRGPDGVEQSTQRIDLAHIHADAELQRQGIAVGEPVQLDLRKLSLALAGRKRGRQRQRQTNRASRRDSSRYSAAFADPNSVWARTEFEIRASKRAFRHHRHRSNRQCDASASRKPASQGRMYRVRSGGKVHPPRAQAPRKQPASHREFHQRHFDRRRSIGGDETPPGALRRRFMSPASPCQSVRARGPFRSGRA